MLKVLFYVIVSAFIFAPCVGLLVFSVWLASDRQAGGGSDKYGGQSPLTSEEAVELIKPADVQAKKAVPKVVKSHVAAVHAGATLIRPAPVKLVQTNTAAVHAGATLIKSPPSPLAVSGKPRTSPLNLTPPNFATRKQQKPKVARAEPAVSVKPITPKRKDNGDATIANVVEPSIDATDAEHRGQSRTKSGVRDRRRLPVATSALPAAKTKNRRMRGSDVNELKRAVGQLNDKDRRAFRSRCRQILSAPERFARRHIEICTAASL